MEQACMLCHRAQLDPEIYGTMLVYRELRIHWFCLFFIENLNWEPSAEEGIVEFSYEEIRRATNEAAEKNCCVCNKSGASITCQETGCDRRFHLPCAVGGGCITQYFIPYRSFCWEHRPRQAVEVAPEEGTSCLICLETVDSQMSFITMVCPACQHAWFHRRCIQGQALCSGIPAFRCPLCRNRSQFLQEMFRMGIHIPLRPPAWEEIDAVLPLIERHGHCDARECLCPGGREQAEEHGPWELLLCCSCAAEGTHRGCSSVSQHTASWECSGCAGPSNASRANLELERPNATSQSESGSSCSSQPSDTMTTSTSNQATLGPSNVSNVLEGSSLSSSPGPDREQNRARLQHRAQTPYSRPSRRCKSSREAATRAETSTHSQVPSEPSNSSLQSDTRSTSAASQAVPGGSDSSPEPESTGRTRPSGPGRVQSRSCRQRRAATPQRQPRQRRGSSRAGARRAETSTRNQVPPEPSNSSLESHISPPRTDRVRSRSRRQRRSQTPQRRPRQCRGRSCTAARRAETSSHRRSSQVPSGTSTSSRGPNRVRSGSRRQRRAETPQRRPSRRRGRSCTAARRAETSTPSQVATEPSNSSPAPDTTSPSLGSLAALGTSNGSPGLESSGRSSPPGSDRLRNRTRGQRQAQTPYNRPSRRRGRRRTAAESGTPSQAVLGPSRSSPVPGTSSPSTESSSRPIGPGPVRARDRSCLRRGAQSPYGQLRHRRRT